MRALECPTGKSDERLTDGAYSASAHGPPGGAPRERSKRSEAAGPMADPKILWLERPKKR